LCNSETFSSEKYSQNMNKTGTAKIGFGRAFLKKPLKEEEKVK
jgi:hypothetical protein